MTQPYFVLDTWVLETASKPTEGRQDDFMMATEFLSRIYNVCFSIVLDYQGEILSEYEGHMKEFSKNWFVTMSGRKTERERPKILFRGRSDLRLDERVDPDDMKFLEVAVNVPGKQVVSGDSDLLSIKDRSDIKSYGIVIWSLREALNNTPSSRVTNQT